jgi:hypothetical protein
MQTEGIYLSSFLFKKFISCFFCSQKLGMCWAWWYTHIIPALGRLRQEDCKVQASLGKVSKEKKKKKKMCLLARQRSMSCGQ